jgi:adenylate cyclase
VISRHSAAKYKGQLVDIRRVGEELGVRYAVEGSARKVGDLLRVNVQLLSTDANAHLWAGRFDQDLSDPAKGQEEIVSRLRAALGLQLVNAERARALQQRPDQPDAFDHLLRGWYAWANPPGPEELKQAADAFARALKLDPSMVPAMCGLASVLIDQFMIPGGSDWGNENALEMTSGLIAAAAAREPENERLLFCQGYLLRAQARVMEAIALLQRVIEIVPNDFAAYRQLGFCWIASGMQEAALPLLEKAIRLDPLSVSNRFVCWGMGFSLVLLKHDQEALPWLRQALAGGAMSRPIWRSRCYLYMATAHALIGDADEARRALAEANRLWPFATVRAMTPAITGPRGRPGPGLNTQFCRMREGARLAGLRDHADEDADHGLAPLSTLHQELIGPTPMVVPGVKTIRTAELAELLNQHHPILLDAAFESWGWSIPGAIGLQGTGHGAAFSDTLQKGFKAKVQELTGGDFSVPIVAFCVNAERFTSYNLALRLVGLGYRNVYWYRGGREAWTLNNLPEAELTVQEWW